MNELVPDVLEVLDSEVIMTRFPAEGGGIITVVEDKVRGFDEKIYTCYHQSTHCGGMTFRGPYYGFKLADATPAPDIEDVLEDTQPIEAIQS